MNDLLVAIPAFIVTLGILITIHEFGHFWVARTLGVKVLRFSIGFGKPLWTRRAGPDNIEYVIAALPLGGYVKMLDETEGEVASHELHRAFNRQHVAKRFAIVSAGPIFNFLFAIFAYWLMFVIGVEGLKPLVGEIAPDSIAYTAGMKSGDEIVAVEDQATPTWETVRFALIDKLIEHELVNVTVRGSDASLRRLTLKISPAASTDPGAMLNTLGMRPFFPPLPAVIGEVVPGGAAEQAGLLNGDRIFTADGRIIKDWEGWVSYVQGHPGQLIELNIERNNKPLRLSLRPGSKKSETGAIMGHIGAGPSLPKEIPTAVRAELSYSPGSALRQALIKSWEVSSLSLRMLGKMVVGEASLKNLSGPISIAQYAGYSASDGLATFLGFLAIVSISLGIVNLLPVPLLDGGHLMYYLIEAAKGSPVSQKVQLIGQQFGIVLLLSMVVLAFYNDLMRLFGPYS